MASKPELSPPVWHPFDSCRPRRRKKSAHYSVATKFRNSGYSPPKVACALCQIVTQSTASSPVASPGRCADTGTVLRAERRLQKFYADLCIHPAEPTPRTVSSRAHTQNCVQPQRSQQDLIPWRSLTNSCMKGDSVLECQHELHATQKPARSITYHASRTAVSCPIW